MPKPMTVSAPAELLPYLFTAWPELKKKQIRVWLKFRAITVNGNVVAKHDHPLKVGDIVAVRSERHALPNTKITAGIRVIHEDADLIVVDKPAGLLSIASDRESERTVYSYLMDHVREASKSARVWIVHRLDQETSGLMLLAKSEPVKRQIQEAWGDVEKKYNSIVEGRPPADTGLIENELDESDPYRVRSAARSELTRHAITRYRVIRHAGPVTWVELDLITGRRHQIRVHLAEVGCPIVGDKRYGASANPIKRLALQAKFLEFVHPKTAAKLTFELPLPGEFGNLLNLSEAGELKSLQHGNHPLQTPARRSDPRDFQ